MYKNGQICKNASKESYLHMYTSHTHTHTQKTEKQKYKLDTEIETSNCKIKMLRTVVHTEKFNCRRIKTTYHEVGNCHGRCKNA